MRPISISCLSAMIFAPRKISSPFFQSRVRKVSLHQLMHACVPKAKKGHSSARSRLLRPTIAIAPSFGRFKHSPVPGRSPARTRKSFVQSHTRPGPSQAAILICSAKSMSWFGAFARNGAAVMTRSISRLALEESSRPNFWFRHCKCDTMYAKLRYGSQSQSWPTSFPPRMQAKQLRNRTQDEEANENSRCHDDEQNRKHRDNEKPI